LLVNEGSAGVFTPREQLGRHLYLRRQ